MKRVERYIGLTLLQTIFMVLFALIGLQFFLSLVNELKDIGIGDYTFAKAIVYVMLALPEQIYELFPMAGLVGVLLGLGILASHSELIVMRAAGLSQWRILCSAMKSMLLITVLMVMVGEGIAPFADHYAETTKAIATSGGQAIKTQQGLWLKVGDTFLHVTKVAGGGHLQEVDRYLFGENHQLQRVSHARYADFTNGKWELYDVNSTEFTSGYLRSSHQNVELWQAKLNPKLLGMGEKAPTELDLHSLHKYMHYLRDNDLSATRFALNFWQRIFMPLTIFVMMLLAVPFVFGHLRQATLGLRLVAGIGIGFAYYICNQFFGPLAEVFQLSVILVAAIPPCLFAMLGCSYWIYCVRRV